MVAKKPYKIFKNFEKCKGKIVDMKVDELNNMLFAMCLDTSSRFYLHIYNLPATDDNNNTNTIQSFYLDIK